MNYDFDNLARAIASGISRREALKRMGAGLASLLFTTMGIRKASAAVTCGTCQACDLDTSTCGTVCNPTTAGQSLCSMAGQDGSYLRLSDYLTSTGYATIGQADSVTFFRSGQLQQSVLVQNFQSSRAAADTAYIGYASSPAGDTYVFGIMLSAALPTFSLTVDPSGRIVTSVATNTTSGSGASHQALLKQPDKSSFASAPRPIALSSASAAVTAQLTPTVCGEIVDDTCKWVDSVFWKPLCKFVAIDICTLLSGPLIPACIFVLNKLCDKLNDLGVDACEQQLKASFCTCPPNQQLCGSLCCNYCENCDQNSGACVSISCGADQNGVKHVCCSGSTGNICCAAGDSCVNGVCTSPNPGCIGATCSTFVPCSTNTDCVCGTVAEGGGLCVPGSTACAGLTKCSSTADCAAGSLCLIETCCGVGVCVPTSLTCPPENSASAMAKRHANPVTGPTIGHR